MQMRTTTCVPDLGLPTFAGDSTKWMSFIEQFNAIVDRRAGLTDSEKFQYLLMALWAPASKMVESIEINNHNYNIAMTLLKERYDNKTLIVQEHIRLLFEIKTVEKNSRQDLRELIDTTRAHLRALQSLGRPVDQWDDIILNLLQTKLDYYSLARWQEEAPANRFPTLDDLFCTLSRRCLVLESTVRNLNSSSSKQSPSTSSGGGSRSSFQSKANSSVASSTKESPNESPKKEQCAYCNKRTNHNIYRCDRFAKLTPAERTIEAKRLKICLNCLKPGHFSSSCRTN